MSWNHIVIEGYCCFDKSAKDVPECCKYKPGILGLHCLDYNEDVFKRIGTSHRT